MRHASFYHDENCKQPAHNSRHILFRKFSHFERSPFPAPLLIRFWSNTVIRSESLSVYIGEMRAGEFLPYPSSSLNYLFQTAFFQINSDMLEEGYMSPKSILLCQNSRYVSKMIFRCSFECCLLCYSFEYSGNSNEVAILTLLLDCFTIRRFCRVFLPEESAINW